MIRDLLDSVRIHRTAVKAVKENDEAALKGATKYLESLEPQIRELGDKTKTEECKNCSTCVKDLGHTISVIFALTTLKGNETISSAGDAMRVFNEGWEKFEKCWKQNAGQQTNQPEFDALKAIFTSTLGSSVEGVIQAQKASIDKQSKKMDKLVSNKEKRQEKEDEKKGEKKTEKKADKKAAKK